MSTEEKKEKVVEKEVTAIYKVNLHCPKCAQDIRKPLLRTQGVRTVDTKFEKSEITVTGIFDEKKIHKQIEKLSRRKVEILPAPPKPKEAAVVAVKETKQVTVRTTTIKVYMHCTKCEHDLRQKLLRHKGIHSVKTDMKAQIIIIEGTIESEKLVTYMKKRVHKHAEIVPTKVEKKEETKEEKVIIEKKSTETTNIVEFKKEEKIEAKSADGKSPYFVHYVYAPQLFSDENPNACSIM